MPGSPADFLHVLSVLWFLIMLYSNKIKPLGKACPVERVFRGNNLEVTEVQATEVIGILSLECKQY